MNVKGKLLYLGETPIPENVSAAAGDWQFAPCRDGMPLSAQFRDATLVAVVPNGAAADVRWLSAVLNELDRSSAVGVFLLPPDATVARNLLSRRAGHFLCVSSEGSAAELAAVFEAAGGLQPAIRSLRTELSALPAGGDAAELDEEMRLASRLQRDFLPRELPQVGPVRFSVLFRPAGWVSGDIYDVARLDETRVGFYVADAVGHGMPAALMTMFIKRALQTKRITGNTYEIIPPGESMAQLNTDLCDQQLSSCQFCTVAYGIVDTGDLTLTFARAGHPAPILLRDGKVESLDAPGGLLGVFPEEQFEARRRQLRAGDRVLFYSDGAEDALCWTPQGGRKDLHAVLSAWADTSSERILARIGEHVDATRRAYGPRDDATAVVLNVA